MRTAIAAAFLLTLSTAAFAYPPQCTSQYGYSAACCAASYERHAEGTMNNAKRHAELKACSSKKKH
jgi:hypothetical protein